MAVRLSLHSELDVGMDVTEVTEEVLQLFGSTEPYHECQTRNGTDKWTCKAPLLSPLQCLP
jgi:hypothetical protein